MSKEDVIEVEGTVVEALPNTNFKVEKSPRCKHAFTCPIMKVSSRVWHALSHVCSLYKWLCFCVLLLYMTV